MPGGLLSGFFGPFIVPSCAFTARRAATSRSAPAPRRAPREASSNPPDVPTADSCLRSRSSRRSLLHVGLTYVNINWSTSSFPPFRFRTRPLGFPSRDPSADCPTDRLVQRHASLPFACADQRLIHLLRKPRVHLTHPLPRLS